MKSKIAARVALGACVLIIAGASAAWACTASPYMNALTTPARPSGSVATASGGSFPTVLATNAQPGGVEIRWNSVEGPVLATAAGPSFSVPVTIPTQAGAGIYYLVGVSRDSNGAILGKAATPVEVTGSAKGANAASSAADADLWSGFAANGDSLGSTLEAGSGSPANSAPLSAGIALLAAGAVSLAAGLTIAMRKKSRSRS